MNIPRQIISEFCSRNHIRKLTLFGSVLREDFGPNSDVDVLVEFEPEHIPGLRFFALEQELSAILGRKVDLHTPKSLSPSLLESVLKEARVEYAET
jgi:uncharacterized protein